MNDPATALPSTIRETLSRHARVDGRHIEPVHQAVEMTVEKGERPVMEPESLPDPVPDEKPRVEHRDPRLVARHELAIHVHLDRGIAVVGHGRVCGGGHFVEGSEPFDRPIEDGGLRRRCPGC